MFKKILISLLLFCNVSFADHIEDYNFGVTQIPVICGTNESVNEFLTDEGLTAKTLSLGREGGEESGSVVFLITYYENFEKTKSATTVQVPNSDEVCILYYTFDLMEAPKKKGI
jgi:hypothetical protein